MEREGNMIGEPVAPPDDDIDKYLASSDSEDDQRYKWFVIIYLCFLVYYHSQQVLTFYLLDLFYEIINNLHQDY